MMAEYREAAKAFAEYVNSQDPTMSELREKVRMFVEKTARHAKPSGVESLTDTLMKMIGEEMKYR